MQLKWLNQITYIFISQIDNILLRKCDDEFYISVGNMSGIKCLQSSASVLAKTTFRDVFSSNL